MDENTILIIALIALGIGATIGGIVWAMSQGARKGRADLLQEQDAAGANRRKLAEEEAALVISEATSRAKQLEIKARDEAIKLTAEAEETVKKRRTDLDRESERLDRRREDVDKRIERLDLRERELNKRQSSMDKRKQELDKIFEEHR